MTRENRNKFEFINKNDQIEENQKNVETDIQKNLYIEIIRLNNLRLWTSTFLIGFNLQIIKHCNGKKKITNASVAYSQACVKSIRLLGMLKYFLKKFRYPETHLPKHKKNNFK